jgi:hypothetical protein
MIGPCATLALLHANHPALPHARLERAAAGLEVRDAYGTPNELLSDHFAAHWGDLGGVDPSDVEPLLDAFELAWAVEIDQMGHPAPATTEAYRFNVYVGDTGDGAPDGLGAGGYYYVDPDGFPMVVIALQSLQDPEFADHAAFHEFYHAIQGSTARYSYDGLAAWYWEATAEWAAVRVDPDNAYNGPFAPGYLMLPELPVDFFDYPDSGALQEYHQYGAFLFPLDLADRLGDDVVRDSWTVPGPLDDPLEVLRSEAADAGEDFDELWLDHLAHNAAFDYAAGDLYEANTVAWESFYPTHRIADTVPRDGGSGHLGGDLAPYRYGAGQVLLESPRAGTLEVRVTGDRKGSEGSPARWGARVTREHADGTVEILAVPFDGRDGALDVPDVGDEDRVWLSIGAWTEDPLAWTVERFEADWSLAIVEPTTPPTATDTSGDGETAGPRGDDPPAGCGCDTNGIGIGWLGALALLGRRRR